MKNKSLPNDLMHRLQYLKSHHENLLVDLIGILEEVMEFSRITGTPVHELLGISEEKLKELMEKHEEGRKPLVRVMAPSFEVEP